MSRSFCHFPAAAFAGSDSEKSWKRQYNRTYRRVVKMRLRSNWTEEDLLLPLLDEVANVYNSPKDGTKRYWPYVPGRWNTYFDYYRRAFMK